MSILGCSFDLRSLKSSIKLHDRSIVLILIRPFQINLVHRPHLFFHDSIYEDYAVTCVNFRGGNDCCVVLKSGTEFCAFTGPPKHLSSPPAATTAMSSNSRRTFCCITRTTVATKGIILHTRYRDFVKG